ncbi:uncharacterized protein BDR25DRAFT_233864 [Lindgomyces ingoldianus]|uniref:Uncharacterized protein n=1 Tax=Lindgomyces ingoldianus TaxID=673940 RepID=A0ACB6QKS0_9PLEO|nr:uncharacterized protein BDR25DRAFT_233864 [Lindgomyces ingoldianus]KAF2467593.1 hypothetical protein BDR25DRAFT_233864 [Lindgomyces ingoldianus]
MPLQRRYSVTGQTPPDGVPAMKSPKLQALDTSVQSTSCGLCEGGDTVRTSAKRSATQIPSPDTPSSQELPTKIARLGLDQDDMDVDSSQDSLTDPFPDSDDWALSPFDSSSSSIPSSPVFSSTNRPDESPRSLPGPEDLALSLALLPPLPSTAPSYGLPPTFLTLPPELRHQIYLHLPDLILPHPLIYCLSTFANKKQHPLASVSQLVRSEALAIFYSYNTWIIKLEYKIMYDAFQDWIIRLGSGACSLRLVNIAVRGALFKPRTSHSSSITMGALIGANVNAPINGGIVPVVEEYHPPDGDASFGIDLSEKWEGGKVELLRNDGTKDAGEKARLYLQKLVTGLWEKRARGTLNGQDWVDLVDQFLGFTGWW